MELKKWISALFIGMIAFSTLSAQENDPNIANQFNSWFMYFGNHRLSERWGLHTEYQWRRSEGAKFWQQSLMRLGIDYYTKSNVMLTGGYGWIVTYPYGEQPIGQETTEHRLWQQLILNQTAGRFNFQHRYRLEQRWIENTAGAGDAWTYANRARYRLFVAIPLNRKTMTENTWFLALYDEIFLGFGKNVSKKNILDQNRAYAAIGYQLRPGVNLQLGYLYHQVFKSDGIRRENNHTLQVGLTYNLDFRRD